MSTLAEIEAAAAKLPHDAQRDLLEWLAARVGDSGSMQALRHSVLDVAPVSLGGLIDSGPRNNDILDEMLEDRF